MKSIKLPICLFLVVIFGFSGCSLLGGAPSNQGPSDPLSAVFNTNEAVRQQVVLAMQQAAERASISIQSNSAVFLSRDDMAVASTLVSPFDQPLAFEDETNRVVDIGLVYLALPPAVGLPNGFYKVRIFIIQSRVELIDLNGQPAMALPLEHVAFVTGSNRPMIMATGCDVTFIYNQPQQQAPTITVEVAFRIDWCPRLIGR